MMKILSTYHILRNGRWRQGVGRRVTRRARHLSFRLRLRESGAHVVVHGLTICKRGQQRTLAAARRQTRANESGDRRRAAGHDAAASGDGCGRRTGRQAHRIGHFLQNQTAVGRLLEAGGSGRKRTGSAAAEAGAARRLRMRLAARLLRQSRHLRQTGRSRTARVARFQHVIVLSGETVRRVVVGLLHVGRHFGRVVAALVAQLRVQLRDQVGLHFVPAQIVERLHQRTTAVHLEAQRIVKRLVMDRVGRRHSALTVRTATRRMRQSRDGHRRKLTTCPPSRGASSTNLREMPLATIRTIRTIRTSQSTSVRRKT